MITLTQDAIDLILESEGIDQPWRWPGGGSGITLGYGCDIGVDPDSLAFWAVFLTPSEMKILGTARGITGRAAAQIQTRFRGINVTRAESLAVFMEQSLPREIATALKGFPGLEFMPSTVIGGMVSLVFNRGSAIKDTTGSNRRREMRIIHEILADFATMTPAMRKVWMPEYATKISRQMRRMKRLWLNKGLDGLLVRRDAEADLVLQAAKIPTSRIA